MHVYMYIYGCCHIETSCITGSAPTQAHQAAGAVSALSVASPIGMFKQ